MPPEMSPEIVSIIGVGIALLTVIAAFAGLLVTLLLRMDRRNERRFEGLTAEVKAVTQAQIRTDHQVEVLTDQMKELVSEVKALAIAQARTDEQVQGLTEQVKALVIAQARTDEQVQALVQAQARTDEQVQALVQAQARTDHQLEKFDR